MALKVKNNTHLFTILWLLILLLNSCNYTKYIPQNKHLLSKNGLKLTTPKPIKYKGEFESSILSLVQPQPNSHMFDLDMLPKYKLWKYNNRLKYYEKNPNDKKITKRKVEKPVLLDTILVNKSVKQIKQFMINQGYYFSDVYSTIKTNDDKTSSVEYIVNAGKSYHIKNVIYKTDNGILNSELEELKNNSFIKKGDIFTNYSCGLERERIYKILRNKGYYDFKTDNTTFIADTSKLSSLSSLLDDPFEATFNYKIDSSQNDSIEVFVNIEQTRDSTYFLKYSIDSILVTVSDINKPFDENKPYLFNSLEGINFRYHTLPVNRRVVTQNIFLHKHDTYNSKNIEATINRLNQLNIFKNINIRFDKQKDTTGSLICYINLDIADKFEFQYLGDISTSDDYFIGLGSSLTFRDKNVFWGGNQLSLRGAYSIQLRQNTQDNNKLILFGNNANISSTLAFPKFIVPFNPNVFSKKNVPFTVLAFNSNYINRINNYSILNFTGSFGYSWKENDNKSWSFNPAFITLNFVPDERLSQSIKELKKTNNYINSNFSNNIIYGENVLFQYKSTPKSLYGNYTTIKFAFEEAGSILTGINYLYNNITAKNIEPIAHYIRTEFDIRKYINYRKSEWVNRVMVGIGMPLSGNVSLPYVKQFSSNIRGWNPRTLGPGRSVDFANANSDITFIDKTGDIKFEANTEYRFNLLKLFSGVINIKGATFVDIGNIWLYNKSGDVLGGEFSTKYFFNDLACSTGLGLRFDFSFFIFRLDYGYPIKTPSKEADYGFNIKDFKLSKSVPTFGINYPF